MDAPCKNCEHKGCGSYHMKCEAYKKYTENLKDIYEQRKKDVADYEWKKKRRYGK